VRTELAQLSSPNDALAPPPAGPLEASAQRAAATCSPFVQPMLTALLRVLILRELCRVHERMDHPEACRYLRRVMHGLSDTSAADAIESHLASSTADRADGKRDMRGAVPARKKMLSEPAWQQQLMSVGHARVRRALSALLTVPALPDEPSLSPAARSSAGSSSRATPRPYLMRSMLSQLCEMEAAATSDDVLAATWLVCGLKALQPAVQLDFKPAGAAAGGAGSKPPCGNVGATVRAAMRAALLSDGRCNAVRMLIALAQALDRRWPALSVKGDVALVASMLLASGRVDTAPDAPAAWQAVRDLCTAGPADAHVVRFMRVRILLSAFSQSS
jgi:hypothetical protein